MPCILSSLTGFFCCQDLVIKASIGGEDSHSRVHEQGVLALLSNNKRGVSRCVVVDNGNLLILIATPVNTAYLALNLKGIFTDIQLVALHLCEDDVILGHVDRVCEGYASVWRADINDDVRTCRQRHGYALTVVDTHHRDAHCEIVTFGYMLHNLMVVLIG